MSQQQNCQTYMACMSPASGGGGTITPGTGEIGPRTLSVFRLPCISTENVDVTQNKTQLPSCRGDSQQFDNVDSTSFSATGQIEIKDPISELFARILYKKACLCLPACFLFLTPRASLLSDGDNIFGSPPDLVSGIVICGVPDATWTRDQSGKNLSFTVTPTQGALVGGLNSPNFTAGKYEDWLDFLSQNQISISQTSVPSDDLSSLSSIQIASQIDIVSAFEEELNNATP